MDLLVIYPIVDLRQHRCFLHPASLPPAALFAAVSLCPTPARYILHSGPAAAPLPHYSSPSLPVADLCPSVLPHAPHQLVIYPIVDLRQHRCDLHWYLRSLEEVIIRGVEEGFGIRAGREAGMTGVWAGGCG
ncbi:unnamed protein product [Closterium sp. Naga37s-1]|nr:unnamed protein product [Closterium sp. Naga37s-1]